ncbi:hypothetical protein [Demequina muriae]|uniref:Uncharacterized protein n=1 Tax=Demequina muriae TaxID=3051664 RepID=A0ABT8GI35_9MICO|nr:hypothetical protein [Demequina sp. EGI L300058]MDN4481091.1 hypothetical protein [Demequina sp. EGI L300058]
MPDPTDQSKEEFHEGTEALQSIADDVEAERERSGSGTNLPNDDDTAEGEAETREDHLEPDVATPLDHRLDEQK